MCFCAPKIIKDSNKIMISDKLGLMMKYPSFNVIVSNKGKSESETLIDLIVDCIDYVFDENQIYKSKDTPRQELIDLVESLQSKDLDKINLDRCMEIYKERIKNPGEFVFVFVVFYL